MRNRQGETCEQIAKNQRVTLLELLDRLLDKGVMVKGEILLSVADIDLVYLNLGLLLSSVKTVENAARRGGNGEAKWLAPYSSSPEQFVDKLQQEAGRKEVAPTPLYKENSQRRDPNGKPPARTLSSALNSAINQRLEPKTDIDPKSVEKGLSKLVLTLVDLIRKLMEKQAIRRIEEEQLSAREIENMGNAFFLLDEKMEHLKKMFGLTDEDLNLDLGPLGELL